MQQTRHCVVAATLFARQLPDVQPGLEFGHRHHAIQQPAAIGALGCPGVQLRAGLKLSRDSFQHVQWRHHSLHHTVFVNHQQETGGAFAELLEQFHPAERLGHKNRRQSAVSHTLFLNRGGICIGMRLRQQIA